MAWGHEATIDLDLLRTDCVLNRIPLSHVSRACLSFFPLLSSVLAHPTSAGWGSSLLGLGLGD